MAKRNVSDADVESVLNHEVQPPRPGNRPGRIIKCGFDVKGNLLEVVVNDYGEVVNVLWP
jgi:hypothetical protein